MSVRVSWWITVGAVLVLAMIAAVVSYSHMYELAVRHGEPEWRATLFPLSVDGMIVASSMTLLAAARRGRRGGALPWTLLVLGSVASLAANVAVADPTMWSRVIHAWPAFALIGAFELLMSEFRTAAQSTRSSNAVRTQSDAREDEDGVEPSMGEPLVEPDPPALRALQENRASPPVDDGPSPAEGSPPPAIQREAWAWALANRRADGTLPKGKEVAKRFERKPRWGRLVKQRGAQGLLGYGSEEFEDLAVTSTVSR